MCRKERPEEESWMWAEVLLELLASLLWLMAISLGGREGEMGKGD